MSLLSLFTRWRREAPASEPVPSQPRGPDATQPLPTYTPAPVAADAGARRHERVSRREHLYTVVRESMNRAGVLSSAYRFKVLSLDGWGKQFLVMIDLTGGAELTSTSQASIELVMGQTALARYEIIVKAVYWRQPTAYNASRVQTAPRMATSVPPLTPVAPAAQRPAQAPVPVPRPAATPAPYRAAPPLVMEPPGADEYDAFRQALASVPASLPGHSEPAPLPTLPEISLPPLATKAPASKSEALLLTGFEDTEINAEQPRGALSATQYGDLN